MEPREPKRAGEPAGSDRPAYVEVAVPLPLDGPLTYEVPESFAALARPGARARGRVGRRRLVGVIVGRREEPPEGVALRPLEAVVDPRPVLPEELLDLAAFVSDYYLAPLGEVLRAMLPADLAPWGDQRIWLTDAGALATPRDADEAAVVEALLASGRTTLAALQGAVGGAALDEAVERLRAAGRVVTGARDRRGARYRAAVELAPGTLEELVDRCGRSAPGREVVRFLAALGRPATVDEVLEAVGCTAAVVRRLTRLGLLRRFTQIERLDLDRHLIASGSGTAGEAIVLRADQHAAAEAIQEALADGGYSAFLVTGTTGAGKTEVYLRAAAAADAAGRGAVLLVPEIALVPALARTLRERFGARLAILHSALSGPERRQEWERIRRGEARVVLGPRSAVFAPVRDPALFVVDEEQDPSYKQDSTPRYQGRDLALYRARELGAAAVVVSATPSLETRRNVERGKIEALTLTERVGGAREPEGILVDLKAEGLTRRPGEVHFSERLRAELAAALAAGDQAILLRNRRGYAPILLCRACGEDMRCDDCGLPRTYHKRGNELLCHYCGSRRPAPGRCPSCEEAALEPIGAGTERVEETFAELFPGVAVDTLDRDAVRRRGSVAAVLERFGRGDTRVLVGTQMVAKGHHFPRVALTAVLQADTYLGFPDFRAVERTYTMLTQLAGRAGRGERPGKVVIQTFHPDHYAIRAALERDDRAFADEEMRFRRIFHYPPFTRMIQLRLEDRDRARGERAIGALARRLAAHPLAEGVRVLGPAPAPFERLRGRWRFQILLRGASGTRLRKLVRAATPETHPGDLIVDVDPYELL